MSPSAAGSFPTTGSSSRPLLLDSRNGGITGRGNADGGAVDAIAVAVAGRSLARWLAGGGCSVSCRRSGPAASSAASRSRLCELAPLLVLLATGSTVLALASREEEGAVNLALASVEGARVVLALVSVEARRSARSTNDMATRSR